MYLDFSQEHIGLRLVVLFEMMILLPAEAYFRMRAGARGERLDRKQEGLFALIALRLGLLGRWIVLAAFLVNPNWLSWSGLSLPLWLRGCGAALGLLSTAAAIWVLKTLGPNLTDTIVARSDANLVVAGPYRLVRHPLYTLFGFMALADMLTIDSWAIAALDIAVWAILVRRIPAEEARLYQHFGDSYVAYCASTPRFIPKWRPRLPLV